MSLNGPNSCVLDETTGMIIYPAGCTVVFYDPATKNQSYIISKEKKPILSLDISSDGQLLLTGEVILHSYINKPSKLLK